MSSNYPTLVPVLRRSEAHERLDETLEAHRIVADLFSPRATFYWIELIGLALAGWGALALAVIWGPGARATYPALSISILALYRASIFSHEISHLNGKSPRGYRAAWDGLIGIPLMLPSFIYVGMHKDHHKLTTYGTSNDPEYLPMAGHKGQIVRFAAGSLMLPALCALRFVVLSPIGLFSRRFHDLLERHASSLTINHQYQRHMTQSERSRMRGLEALTLCFWWLALALAFEHVLPWRAFAFWYAVLAMAGLANTIRALGAHRYESDGRPMTRLQQLRDSIDTPGGFWTELWAPVGLRYHALHHYFPGLPYHNLGKAYRRLMAALAQEAAYRNSTSESLADSLRVLWNHPPVMPYQSPQETPTPQSPPQQRAA